MLGGGPNRRGVWERIDTYMCMAEFLCYPLETIIVLLIGCTPIQNLKLEKMK